MRSVIDIIFLKSLSQLQIITKTGHIIKCGLLPKLLKVNLISIDIIDDAIEFEMM